MREWELLILKITSKNLNHGLFNTYNRIPCVGNLNSKNEIRSVYSENSTEKANDEDLINNCKREKIEAI